MRGQTAIVEEVLKMNPSLARILDSQQSSPLHIAAAQGHVEISRKLLSVAPVTRWWQDCHDMNPVHIAAINGHVEMLGHLLVESLLPAMERVGRGQTVLHLCVKHGQLTTLQVLGEKLWELMDEVDEDGETLLHLAVRSNQLEILQYLGESNKIRRRKRNCVGKTALQILNQSPPATIASYSEMRRILRTLLGPPSVKILPKINDAAMVVVVLIATMAFQNTVNPPGGVWQDNTSSHEAGNAVIAYTHPYIYKHMLRANTVAFVSSLVTIFLITTGLPSMSFTFLMTALCAMWASMTAIAVSYGASILAITPNADTESPAAGVVVRIVVSLSLSILVLIFLFARITRWYFMWMRRTRHQEDLTTDPLPLRLLYWIFQHLRRTDVSENNVNR
ncbi:ankyrin repeat-containing protein NPR4-like [Salvia miltiorrhiza]|uniref:ankyrin repeat-containing protein NPR4-like n=1 Tax=Salvia miltiorrhiza TaxID=226208 RepID=UPI0025ABE290|nr:ankyrin repeat-containing protein NPR4-like [Salvia miltiorrhiza]